MKSKTKVKYLWGVISTTLDDKVNKEIEAIELNIKNKVKDVSIIKSSSPGEYIVQIIYEEQESPEILNE